jgi:hypothetical protein
MEALTYHRTALRNEGGDTSQIESLVTSVAQAKSVQELRSQLATLEPEANKLGWPRDVDFTALLLQHALPHFSSNELRLVALNFAIDRARWCASAATAGGEGLARSVHVKELEALRNEIAV